MGRAEEVQLIKDASIIFINYYYTIRHNKINGGEGIQHPKHTTGNMSVYICIYYNQSLVLIAFA